MHDAIAPCHRTPSHCAPHPPQEAPDQRKLPHTPAHPTHAHRTHHPSEAKLQTTTTNTLLTFCHVGGTLPCGTLHHDCHVIQSTSHPMSHTPSQPTCPLPLPGSQHQEECFALDPHTPRRQRAPHLPKLNQTNASNTSSCSWSASMLPLSCRHQNPTSQSPYIMQA